MNLIIFDFEVFRYNTLLGYGLVDVEKGTCDYKQTWDLDEMRMLYRKYNENSIWIGWNNNHYDDLIFEAIMKDQVSPFVKSKELIGSRRKPYCTIPFFGYDLLNGFLNPPSLKLTEALEGDSIDTSDVDFDLMRPLTQEEIKLTEEYNLSDLRRTFKNFCKFRGNFELRLSLINEFNIPLQRGLRMTGTQIAAAALGAKAIPGIENQIIKPHLYPTLQVKNQEVIDWFLNEKFRDKENLRIHICNTDVNLAAGGAHSEKNKYHCKKALYADISGYYNLVMMNFDLLPRTLGEDGKNKYNFMYHEQLRLKKIDPHKRKIYKTICLAVFGAMNNEYTDFYDPQKALLVTSSGEMFMVDLLEKLDGLGTAFNVNTDGIMFEPFDWKDEQKIRDIIQEWVDRNGFAVKTGIVTDYHGRDVNCYVMREPDGELCCKGEATKNYDISDSAFASGAFFNCKEPPIIAKGIVAAFMDGILPEDFVKQNTKDMRLFQYVCKKNTFDYLEYKLTDTKTGGIVSEKIQSPSRCFVKRGAALTGTIIKHRTKNGKHTFAKVQSLPENVFIWNKEILSDEAVEKISSQLDYEYYVRRIYERINEYL